MRVLYFHQHFSVPTGPGGIRSYCMARRLIDSGHSVTMVCGSFAGNRTGLEGAFVNGKRSGVFEGIDVIEFDLAYSNSDGILLRSWTFLKFAFRSVSLVITQTYDLVFATTTPLTAGVPGIVARHLMRKPFVFEVRDLWPELPKAMGVIKNPIVIHLLSLLELISYRSANHIVSLSPGISQGISRRGIEASRITLIPNGCDLDIFSVPKLELGIEGIKKGDFVALYAGTHGAANGLASTLEVARKLKQKNRHDIKILLVGDGKEKRDLLNVVNQEALDNIIFLDPVKKSELASLMTGVDVGLQLLANIPAFYYGTSPNKFFDYIASGLPVITNYPGWISDLLTQHEAGLSASADDADSFVACLEYLADSPEVRQRLSINAKKLAKGYFDRDQQASKWVECLEFVLNEKRGKSK